MSSKRVSPLPFYFEPSRAQGIDPKHQGQTLLGCLLVEVLCFIDEQLFPFKYWIVVVHINQFLR